jgi:phosphoglycolate phosphatase
MKRLIIYDLDGVLADTSQELVHANAYVLSRLGASPARLEAVHTFAGGGMRDLVAWGLRSDDPKFVGEAEALFTSYYTHHPYRHSRLYSGAQRILDYFKGRTQAILTDRPNPFARDLTEALGILGYFADIIAGNSPYPRKPYPAGALALIAKVGVKPEETLLIGDRPIDIETGRNAGVFTIAVAHGGATASELQASNPDVLADDLFHLLGLARRYKW